MEWRGDNYQRRRGKAALDAATTTTDSPRPQIEFGTGAQPRPEAPGGGAMEWRGVYMQKPWILDY